MRRWVVYAGIIVCIVFCLLLIWHLKIFVSKKSKAITECIRLCEEKRKVMDLSDGPCLSNRIVDDWVCDVAHWPRKPIDDLPQNQCEAYRNGTAHHFVEVTPDCQLIRAI